jgi:Nuclease-related domain
VTTLFCVLVALACGFGVGRVHRDRSASFQNRSEALLSRAIRENFGCPDFHLLNHVTLRLKDGTTQIDHILVSRFGVFVIETKDYTGWIFANARQKTWTQLTFKLKFRFQNPLLQNFRHVVAVRSLLDFLPPSSIKSIVVFAGDAEFKTEIPDGVFTVDGLITHLKNSTEAVISLNRVQFAVGRLETARLAISGKTDVEHIASLQQRHGAGDTKAFLSQAHR